MPDSADAPSEEGAEVAQPPTNDGPQQLVHEHKHQKRTPVGGMHGVGVLGELAKDRGKDRTRLRNFSALFPLLFQISGGNNFFASRECLMMRQERFSVGGLSV